MLKNTARAFGIALILGTSLLTVGALSPTSAVAGEARITNRAVGVPFQEAQNLHRQGQLQAALGKLREARGAEGITNGEIRIIDQTIAAWLLQAKDYRGAMNAFESLGNYEAALGAAMQINDTAKINALIAKMPGGAANAELFMAQGAYNNKRFQEAVTRARPFLQRNPPNLQALQITAAACFELKDEACRRNALELMVLHHPTEQRWCDMLRLTRNTRGLTDQQQLELFALRQSKGCLKTAEEISEFAQVSIIAGYPNDGKLALQKGIAEKVLAPVAGDRTSRLINTVNDAVTKDMATTAAQTAAANQDATGNADVKLARHHFSYGKNAEAEAAVQKGVTKAKVTDMDYARIVLGRAQLAQNKKAEAVRSFNAVPRTSKHYPIARLWSIYAQQS